MMILLRVRSENEGKNKSKEKRNTIHFTQKSSQKDTQRTFHREQKVIAILIAIIMMIPYDTPHTPYLVVGVSSEFISYDDI